MNLWRVANLIVFLAGLAAAVFYIASENEAQGAVVLLTAILYFIAAPKLRAKE